jgi:chorismate mutase
MKRTIWFVLALGMVLGSCAPPATPPPPRANPQERPAEERSADAQRLVDDLLTLMRQRLLVQHEVARYKWHAHLPISDAKREQQLLASAEEHARDLGLEPGFVRAFFQAQMQAGKLVQQDDFDGWRSRDTIPPATGRDLMALRLQIDSLNRKLLQALQEANPSLRKEGRKAVESRAEVVLQGQGITAEVRRAACTTLLGP